jgi:glycosyltransferase involved in cell wall biosynthesis
VSSSPVVVAFDAGPTVGEATGIGRVTAGFAQSLAKHPEDVTLLPYILSFRAQLPPGTVRLRFPARIALRAWGKMDWPTARRTLASAEVVHGTNYVAPPTGLPTLITLHDLTLFQRPELVDPVVSLFGDVIRRAVDRGAYIHTVSQHVATQTTHMFGTDRVRVVHPGPTFDPKQPAGPLPEILHKKTFLLALGTKEPRKNYPRLIQAFDVLCTQLPSCLLVIGGGAGSDDAAIDGAIRNCSANTRDRIIQLGYVGDSVRAALLKDAAAFVYPSLDEGFGLPLIEAMHANLPIVAAAAGSIPEIAGNAALLVDPTNIDSITQGMHTILTDEYLRLQLTAAGTVRREHFSWKRSAIDLCAVYKELRGSS